LSVEVAIKEYMRRIIAVFSCFLISLFIIGCGSINSTNIPPNGPEQARRSNGVSVALVSNFNDADIHPAYCSGVWVDKDTILTAAHCPVGYADMTHRYLIFKALEDAGLSFKEARLIASADSDDLDIAVEMGLIDADVVAQAKLIIAMVPHISPMSLDMTFIGPDQVIDIGAEPKEFFHGNVLVIDEKADLALIRATSYPAHYVAHLAEKLPEVGEELNFSGTPENNSFAFRKVIVSAYRHSEAKDGMDSIHGPFIQVNGPIFHGDSGSGMLNSNGELVGIVSFVDGDIKMCFCIHTDTIRSMLIGQRIIKAKLDTKAKDPDLGEAKINLE
jgi:hypothetical protein